MLARGCRHSEQAADGIPRFGQRVELNNVPYLFFPAAMQGGLTLHDLIAAKAVLQVVCQRCRHQALIYPFELGRTVGWNTPLDDLICRLRCSACDHALATVYEATR